MKKKKEHGNGKQHNNPQQSLTKEQKVNLIMKKAGFQKKETAIKVLELSGGDEKIAIQKSIAIIHKMDAKAKKHNEAKKKNKRTKASSHVEVFTKQQQSYISYMAKNMYITTEEAVQSLKENQWNLVKAMSKYRYKNPTAFMHVLRLPGAISILSSSYMTSEKEKTVTKTAAALSVNIKNFMVYQNKFQCRFKSHEIKDIDASVRIVTDKGEDIFVVVPAGYCKTCETFFIMNSTYEALKKKGTIACRISSEKAYLNGASFVGNMLLAQESVLKQFGYSVSQSDGLSATRREKILALIIDNKILTRAEVIGYLDFFISQHKSSKFEHAVSLWEADKDFVSSYKIGAFTKYGIAGIKYKTD